MILTDSNIFIYACDNTSPFHKKAKEFIADKTQIRGEICVTPQILLEFFGIITQKVKYPLSLRLALKLTCEIKNNKNILCIFPDEKTFEVALNLAEKYSIVGRDIFDLYIVATMLDNNINTLCTHNTQDFKNFDEITTIDPLT